MTLTGVGVVLRLVLRRDRVRIAIWAAALAGLVAVSAASVSGLYDTPESLAEYAALVDGNAALIVQSGPGHGLGDDPTIGAVLMNEVGIWTILAVALMSVFMITRHTRAEEESERIELVRAAPVGRHAPAAAAMIGAVIANLAVACSVVLGLAATGFGGVGAVAFGAAILGAGTVFAAISLVAAQVASSARAATGSAAAAIGVAFVLRAVGDIGNGWLSWLSPIGWAQAVRPFAGERWLVLVLPLAASAGLIALADALTSRRDMGAGLVQQRLGPPAAHPSLSSALALAWRLHRSSLIGWTVGVAAVGVFYGLVAVEAESLLGDNPDLAEFFTQIGDGSITDAFLATALLMLALISTGFTVSAVLRLRGEETAGRADSLIAASVSRRAWATSHLAVAVLGTFVVIGLGGAGAGLGYGLASGQPDEVLRLFGSSIVMVPAALVLGGVAFLLVGAAPRIALAAWAAFAVVVAFGLLGEVLGIPERVQQVSPFRHLPAVPAASPDPVPLVALCVIAAALVVAGLAGIDRRDLA